ncbi:MAG: hypothetical protein IJO34_01490 [Akkermansia sp.]|nr:hypothetical protein [Akkermansia sp.]
MNFPLRSLLLPAIVAVATCSVCRAQDPMPITCEEFEQRFPKAIKYKRHGYYTVRVPGSAAVCFFNERKQLSFAIVLTGAKDNAAKFAEALNMSYNPEATIPDSRQRTVLLYNKRALPYLKGASQSGADLPCSNTFMIAALLQRGNDEDRQCRFVNWATRGITFRFSHRRYGESNIVFSPSNNLITRVHLYPKQDSDNSYYILRQFCKDVFNGRDLFHPTREQQSEMKRDYDLAHVYATSTFEKHILGKIKQGKYVIGEPNPKLSILLSPRPARLPDEESAWPTLPQQPIEQTPPPQEKTQEPPEQGAVNTPPSPLQAIKLYLEHLNSMFQ